MDLSDSVLDLLHAVPSVQSLQNIQQITILLLLVFVQTAYFSTDHSRLGQVPQRSSKEEHLAIVMLAAIIFFSLKSYIAGDIEVKSVLSNWEGLGSRIIFHTQFGVR